MSEFVLQFPIEHVRRLRGASFRFWQAYVRACLRLAEEAGVDGRTLDQALWQWSKDQDQQA